MPNIITPLYFTGEIKIPNAVSGNAGEGINGDLQAIITKYEKELLMRALGFDQYTILQGELAKLPFTEGAEETAGEIWQHLVNGSDKWQGIKRILGNYIYCKYLRFDEVVYTTTGAGKSKVAAHTTADYNQKYVERWNEMVWQYQEGNEEETSLQEFLTDTDGLSAEKFQWLKYENQFGL